MPDSLQPLLVLHMVLSFLLVFVLLVLTSDAPFSTLCCCCCWLVCSAGKLLLLAFLFNAIEQAILIFFLLFSFSVFAG